MSFLTKLPRDLYRKDAFDQFDGRSEGFDRGTARAMAWACQLAYETDEPTKIADIGAMWGLKIPPGHIVSEEIATPLPKASTQCIVCDSANAIIVAFAGTDPPVIADWVSNFDIGMTMAGTANGFTVAADAATRKIDTALSALSADKPIFVTGHSLGGAIAVISAERLHARHPRRVRAVYTFGMPRPGNTAFSTHYNQVLGSCTYRLVHGMDIVPTVAPSSLGFRHVGRMLICVSRGKFSEQSLSPLNGPGSDEPAFMNGISARLKELLHGSMSNVMPMTGRFKVLSALMLGVQTGGVRSDPGGLIIELLPPPLRDHMPDRYIQAAS